MKAGGRTSLAGTASRRGDPNGHVRLSAAERRNYRRSAVTMPALIRLTSEVYEANLIDISPGGAQLRCSVVPRIGADVGIELNGFDIIPARVVRRLPQSIAVEFDMPQHQRDKFAVALDALLKSKL